jgi:hypothetical protein
MSTFLLYLAASLLMMVPYFLFTVPIVTVTRTEAEADPKLSKEVTLGLLVNSSIGLVAMIYFVITLDKVGLIPVVVAVLTGWYMESRGHEGAP